MSANIHILLVEDSEDDAALIIRAVSKGGFYPEWKRVQTAEDLMVALRNGPWDVVISDYSMPAFNGMAALEIVKEYSRNIPFILVSAAVGEETAVEIMRRGASDYVMKDRLGRLAPAIERELREAEIHRERERERVEKLSLENQLRQSQKMESIGTLAGGIAHDLNNILMPILGYAEMARAQAEDGSRLAGQLTEIYKAGLRARDLVGQILSFSRRAEEGLNPLQIQPLLKEALKLLRAVIPATIRIDESIDPKCGTIMADPTHIHQVIMNLGTNAYQSMGDEGGVLRVSLTEAIIEAAGEETKVDLPPGRYVRLEVSDSGTGMDQATMERIFDPYFTTKEIGKGTGLGLSLVYGIVKRADGYIRVESEPGKGATFSLYFPVAKRAAEVVHEASVSEHVLGHESILVIDDEESICRMERQMLESLGYRVAAFTSSGEALKAFARAPQSFDLIITDQTMPRITGAELVGKVRDIRPDIPVILCTGYSEIVDEQQARSLGVREFLIKPVRMKDLERLVRNTLDEENLFKSALHRPLTEG